MRCCTGAGARAERCSGRRCAVGPAVTSAVRHPGDRRTPSWAAPAVPSPQYPNHHYRTVPKARRTPILDVMEHASERRVRLPNDPNPERRASTRFPLALEVRYTVSGRRALRETGSGRTIDLSSSGLRFATQGPLEPAIKLDVAIDWPVLLNGGVQLQLVAKGEVVWSSGTETALRIQRHELRTRGGGRSLVKIRAGEASALVPCLPQ